MNGTKRVRRNGKLKRRKLLRKEERVKRKGEKDEENIKKREFYSHFLLSIN